MPTIHRALLATLVVACSAPSHPKPAAGTKLVVLVIIDQWPEWSFEAKRPALHGGGFDRLLGDGQWLVGRHPTAATLTAPGHALLGTGAPTSITGILANEWWHRDLGRSLRSVEAEDGSTSAVWLRVPGLGDAVAAAHTGSKAVAVSLKDRAAILPLGHSGLALWYDAKSGEITSQQPPPWLADYNRSHPIAARTHEVWTPLDPAHLAQLAGSPDDQPGEVGDKGLGTTFPHDLGATKDPNDAIFAVPAGNDLVFDTGLAAIAGEHLGTHPSPDLLILSLSAHDFIAHAWGQESWESWDGDLRLDARLGQFLGELDRAVGAGAWGMIVTSDHGSSPMPERSGGGRIKYSELQKAANDAASAVLGPGAWIDNAHFPNVYFSKAMLAQPKGELDSAMRRVVFALRAFPGLEKVDRTAPYEGHCETRTGEAQALCYSFDPERSGDLFYMPAKGWITESDDGPLATSHGSLHDYDRLVPVLVVPPGKPASHPAPTAPTGEIPTTQIATMLSTWLGVTAPLQLPRAPAP